ncbi:6-bladed beta-propeller [Maribellus comscasis]|uniref:6-bladed beta-propeller n=1 Tax=Maribellus comscasis TaxID=2681766 RepID=A0A6I6JJ89_9BACT|nr:6-bladed beta-propeller [Maribellus comscasis]QGY42925.1 6-bladed beta-propeller [Maribellus comscasis]
MKNPSTLICLFLIFLAFFSCTKTEKKSQNILYFDLTQNYDEIEIDLDEYVADIRTIQLETNENTLLRHFKGFVGEKYIVSVDYDKLLLFSGDGKYITTITKKGKGPNEFTQIDAWTVDENNHCFYFHDYSKNYIYRYDLENRVYLSDIPFESKGYLQNIELFNDSVLAILPGMFSAYGYLYFFQEFNGKILDGIKKEPVPHPGTWAGASPAFSKWGKNSIVLQPSGSDTVFQINQSEKNPWLIFDLENAQKTGDKTVFTTGGVLFSDNEKLFLEKNKFEKTVTEFSASMRSLSTEQLIFNLKSGKMHSISKITMQFNKIEIPLNIVGFQNNNRLVVSIQAASFKSLLKEAQKNKNLTETEIQKLNAFDQSLSIDDNPIIITGVCKQDIRDLKSI